MSDLVYRNGFSFMIGTSLGFSLSNSFRLLDDADKMPGDIGYDDAYPIGAATVAEMTNNYMEVDSGEAIFEALGDDPGFMAGAALGVYLGEKCFETLYGKSELEEVYSENDLDDVWNDLEY